MKMSTLYTLVGLPGSGKSTYASEKKECITVSSDAIRKELFGDEATQGDNAKIFSIVHERIKEELKKGNDVIFDATNINPRNRKKVFDDDADMNVAVYFNTPVEECKKRNGSRERVVPEYVIDRMAKHMIPPSYEEGFDDIIVIE